MLIGGLQHEPEMLSVLISVDRSIDVRGMGECGMKYPSSP